MNKFKKHQKYFIFFVFISILGILDIATRSYISESYGINDLGAISYYLGIGISFILGSFLGNIIMIVINLIFSFSIIWICIALEEYYQMNKQKKLQLNNSDLLLKKENKKILDKHFPSFTKTIRFFCKLFYKYLPDIIIIFGIWILSYYLLEDDYNVGYEVFGILLITIGIDIMIRRYLHKK